MLEVAETEILLYTGQNNTIRVRLCKYLSL